MTPILLINLPEVTDLPNKPFPPLSLQVLHDSLKTNLGLEAICIDLAQYGPKITSFLSEAEYNDLFSVNTEFGIVAEKAMQDLDISTSCKNAIMNSGVVSELVSFCLKYSPSIIGLSIQGTPLSSDKFSLGLTRFLSIVIKESLSNVKIVVGGARTVEKDHICNLLIRDSNIDYVVRGNGYNSICQIVQYVLYNKGNKTQIRGLVYEHDGKICYNDIDSPWGQLAVPILFDMSAKPYYSVPLEDLAVKARHIPKLSASLDFRISFLPFQFTVGCVSQCAFCNRASEPGKVSAPKQVVDYLEAAVKEYGINNFIFLNSEINFGKTYVMKFCNEIISRDLKIYWSDSCEFRGLDYETLAIMKAAGCVALWFGLETSSNKLLKYINKRTTVEHAKSVLQMSNELGIYNCLNIICGFPYEDEEDVQATLSFLKSNRDIIDTTQVNIFYLQGGPFNDHPEKFGLKKLGYQEQVGETMCKAFEEINGLSWEDKKKQMLSSYLRVAQLDDELFNEDSRNMPLVMTLYNLFAGDKIKVKDVMDKLNNSNFGDFTRSAINIFEKDGIFLLFDTANAQVLQVNEVVASCFKLRHLRVWSRIKEKLLEKFEHQKIEEAIDSIKHMEANGHFSLLIKKPFRSIQQEDSVFI